MVDSAENPSSSDASATDASGPTSEAFAAPEPATASPDSGAAAAAPLEDTPKPLENQEKPENPAAAAKTVVGDKLAGRLQAYDNLLREKEGLQLTFVRAKTPKAYYLRWKSESNQIFALTVGLKRRLNRVKSSA